MKQLIAIFLITALTFTGNVLADPPGGFGSLYADGEVYRTFGVPAATPMGGRDNIYPIVGGVEDQLAVSAVAPGDKDYHGGLWAVHVVMWTAGIEPYLLTSEEEVLEAYLAGDVSISRMLEADFRCPVLPARGKR
ncbi:hypothetical protein [Elongatibacter sediminis]|uniref:Uncharacterized protein n=1 Tax=Elongatibacter sediminis TaxID=3119006 RepID=A0AAW9RGI1_9GAMM